MQYTPVKEAALAHGIPVFQPVKIREAQAVEELRKYNADIMVVIAFGQILPKEILEMTPYGCINVHASLLPSYRGAAPIQWAVINGDKVSGVTTMQMNEGHWQKMRQAEAFMTSLLKQVQSSVLRH